MDKREEITIYLAENGVMVLNGPSYNQAPVRTRGHVFNSKHDLFKYLEECGVLENTTK